jgi:hypothetical protein
MDSKARSPSFFRTALGKPIPGGRMAVAWPKSDKVGVPLGCSRPLALFRFPERCASSANYRPDSPKAKAATQLPWLATLRLTANQATLNTERHNRPPQSACRCRPGGRSAAPPKSRPRVDTVGLPVCDTGYLDPVARNRQSGPYARPVALNTEWDRWLHSSPARSRTTGSCGRDCRETSATGPCLPAPARRPGIFLLDVSLRMIQAGADALSVMRAVRIHNEFCGPSASLSRFKQNVYAVILQFPRLRQDPA